MSSSPGTRPSFGSILAGFVAVLALVGLVFLLVRYGPEIVRSFFPPDPVTTQGQHINDLYTIVFVIAAAIFFLVEALIVWSVIRYRRRPGDDGAAAPDPRPQPRRNRLDRRPDDHRDLPVLHLVADAEYRRSDCAANPTSG